MTKREREEKAYVFWLHQNNALGEKALFYLMEQYGSAREVYQHSREELQELLQKGGWKQKVIQKKLESFAGKPEESKILEEYEKLEEKGIHLVSCFEKEYPMRLKKLSSPPFVLYYKGKLPGEDTPSLAMIGARECSAYGRFLAEAFGKAAGEQKVAVISGMARGIDGISQRAAIHAGGESYAVLGCGVDICYPAANRDLYEEISKCGGVLSSFLPGTEPKRQLFPYRNSIVAGLSDAVLVVEARQHSGTSITVDMALEQGKEVYAVPGRLTDRLSDGCNMLLRTGAGIALSPEDLMREVCLLKNRKVNIRNAELYRSKELEKREAGRENREEKKEEGLLKFLDFYPRPADEILQLAREAGMELTISQLIFELLQLCLSGKADQQGGSYFYKTGK